MRKFSIVVLILAMLGIGGGVYTTLPREAAAQSTDTWSGHSEALVPFSGAITVNAAPAVVVTAVSTIRINVRSLIITNSASGIVQLYDGPNGAGSTVIASFGVIANTPLYVPESALGLGARTTLGNGLYLSGATGTISATVRYRKDPN